MGLHGEFNDLEGKPIKSPLKDSEKDEGLFGDDY